MLTDFLRTTVKGVTSLRALTEGWTGLIRHVCDTPRARESRSLNDLTTLQANSAALS